VFSCSKIEQKQLNTWVSFQSAEQPLLGQFSVSGNTKIKAAKIDFENDARPLSESLYDYVQSLKKGDFAFDCLFYIADEKASFTPPEYMSEGLKWLETQLLPKA